MSKACNFLSGNGGGRIAAGLLLGFAGAALGRDWPQFRGPNHDGISTDRIEKQWPTNGPAVVWRVPLTKGFSGFAVSGGQAFTLVSRLVAGTNQEVCLALDANTGAELWAAPLGPAVYPDGGAGAGDGPRSTPSVDGGLVYTLSAYISLACWNATNGQVVWRKDLRQEYGGSVIPYQNAASPLIEGGLIFVNCNNAAGQQALLALRKTDGSLVWQGQTNQMTHATPVVATLGGTPQVIFFTQPGLIAVAPLTGAVLWRYAFPYSVSSGASPVVAGDIAVCMSAYPIAGAGAVRITGTNASFTATQIWRTNAATLGAQWCTPIYHKGCLYGFFAQHGTGFPTNITMKCADAATGAVKWARATTSAGAPFGAATLLLVDGVLLVQTDSGELLLVEPNPTNYVQIARANVLSGKSWSPLAVSDGRIYARSTTEGVCLNVSVPSLKLLLPLRPAHGALQLVVGTTNGAPVSSERLAGMEVRATPNLTLSVTQWFRLTNRLVLTNGVACLEDVDVTTQPQQFYMVNEPRQQDP